MKCAPQPGKAYGAVTFSNHQSEENTLPKLFNQHSFCVELVARRFHVAQHLAPIVCELAGIGRAI